ncbi:MAG: hypothetical protein EPO39_19145 [Candidatus Manganitrophaceae bacterium]|nr:MAG: hypothetical protein EPO39_19145 [Candidatus Manganitrophaceae bacterium]
MTLMTMRLIRDVGLPVLVVSTLIGCAHVHEQGTMAGEGRPKINEKKIATLDLETVVPRSLFFSPDGRHAIWVSKAGEQFRVVLDGVAGPPVDSLAKGPVVLSPDGRRIVYLIENKTNRRLSVVIDGTPGPEYEKILSGTPIFSPNGRRIAYGALLQEKYQVVLDGMAGPDYELVGHLTFSADSRHFAYAAQKEKKRFIVLDGVAGPPFEDVFISGFSPDSRHLVYYANQEKKQRVVVDQQPGQEFDSIGPIQFLYEKKDGPGQISYVGLRGEEVIQITQALD